jgi:hypothetical protein
VHRRRGTIDAPREDLGGGTVVMDVESKVGVEILADDDPLELKSFERLGVELGLDLEISVRYRLQHSRCAVARTP